MANSKYAAAATLSPTLNELTPSSKSDSAVASSSDENNRINAGIKYLMAMYENHVKLKKPNKSVIPACFKRESIEKKHVISNIASVLNGFRLNACRNNGMDPSHFITAS